MLCKSKRLVARLSLKRIKVKMNLLFGNQQVTNALSKLVETPEAIRPLTYTFSFSYTSLRRDHSPPPAPSSRLPKARLRGSTDRAKSKLSLPYRAPTQPCLREGPKIPLRISRASVLPKVRSQTQAWNPWLAGLIDGDGCLLIRSSGYTSCEITMDLKDEHALQQVKTKLGGSVKLRAGSLSIRYRLHHKNGMEDLIHRINGQIRNSVRQKQLKGLCEKFSIPYIEPGPPAKDSAWFAGFFDANGTVTLSMKHGSPQVTIGVSNKKAEDLFLFKERFSGNIYYDKSSNSFKWSIQGKVAILHFLDYIKTCGASRSSKKFRLFLIPRFFKLSQLKAWKKDSDSLQKRAWDKFVVKWKNREPESVDGTLAYLQAS